MLTCPVCKGEQMDVAPAMGTPLNARFKCRSCSWVGYEPKDPGTLEALFKRHCDSCNHTTSKRVFFDASDDVRTAMPKGYPLLCEKCGLSGIASWPEPKKYDPPKYVFEVSERMYLLRITNTGGKGIAPLLWERATTFWYKDFEAADAYCKEAPGVKDMKVEPYPIIGWDTIIELGEAFMKKGYTRIVINAVPGQDNTSVDMAWFIEQVRLMKDQPAGGGN